MTKIKKSIFNLSQISSALKRNGREFEEPEDLLSEAKELQAFFDLFPLGTNVKLFRVLHAKNESEIDRENLGNHWTHSEHKAKEFAADNLSKPWFLIECIVEHDAVDWAQTLSQNIHHPYEEELYLHSYRGVKNLKIKKIA